MSPTCSRHRIRSGRVIKYPLAVPARVAPTMPITSTPSIGVPLLRSPTGTRKVRPLVAIVLSPWLYLPERKCPLIANVPQIGKMNYLYANVRLTGQAATLPGRLAMLPRTFQGKPAAKASFPPVRSGRVLLGTGRRWGLDGGVSGDREQFRRDHGAGQGAKALLAGRPGCSRAFSPGWRRRSAASWTRRAGPAGRGLGSRP